MTFLTPPTCTDSDGNPRRAGFEFEMGNLSVVQTATALQSDLGGKLTVTSPFSAVIEGSPLGNIKIERDAEILRSGRYRSWLSNLGMDFHPGSIGNEIETRFDSASSQLVPCEVVTAPVPFDQMDQLDKLVASLSELGAEGTQDSLVYAFGLHINPSVASTSSASLRNILQAFMLLQAWIIDISRIDLTRRYLTNFIAPYPVDYMRLILARNYAPGLEKLVEDYLKYNPTRNRALDMLPLFRHLLPDIVGDALAKEERILVRPRPAFHYRLPDCKINQPGWHIHDAWNCWVYIEKLAENQALLTQLIDAWWESGEEFSLTPNTNWARRLATLLAEKFLAGL
jgi:hypothetical protein